MQYKSKYEVNRKQQPGNSLLLGSPRWCHTRTTTLLGWVLIPFFWGFDPFDSTEAVRDLHFSSLTALCQAAISFFLVPSSQLKTLWKHHTRLEPICSDSLSQYKLVWERTLCPGSLHHASGAVRAAPASYLTRCCPVPLQQAGEQKASTTLQNMFWPAQRDPTVCSHPTWVSPGGTS